MFAHLSSSDYFTTNKLLQPVSLSLSLSLSLALSATLPSLVVFVIAAAPLI
jgi:hypothetical protein